MSTAVEDDEAGIGNPRAEDAPERRREQPVVGAPDDQRRRRDGAQRVRDIGGKEIAADLPEPDRADPESVSGRERQAARRRADGARNGEDEPPPRVTGENPGRRDEGKAVDELRRLGGELERRRPAHRVADERRRGQALSLEPLAEPAGGLAVSEPGEPDDVDVVVVLERGDRRPPPVGRRRDPVHKHGRRAHYRKRSRSGGITRSRAEPSPSSSRPRTIAAGIASV